MMTRVLPLLFIAIVLSGCSNDSADLYLKQSAQSTMAGDLFDEQQWREKARTEGTTDKRLIALTQQQEAFRDLEAALFMNQTTDALRYAERVMNQTFGDKALANEAARYHRTLGKVEKAFNDLAGSYAYSTSDQGEYKQDYTDATIDVVTRPNREATLTIHDARDYEGQPLDDYTYSGRFNSDNTLMLYFHESSLEIRFNEDGSLTFRASGIEKDSYIEFEQTTKQSL
ncbi:hypothetical protein [Exiguobacterium acetylicum]|uniref:hypothetical protein n=1 Tax=Exiguobacterium acetylicum TaxID=41170 RepID=UPI0006818A34|nr:hypothetical protein [Exiguobacterium acetylicum]KNH34742.1 hypothetical protein ACS74_09570 [Exiguobacterium acetylicum]